MRRHQAAALLGVVLTLGACGEFNTPDQNASTLSDLTAGTPSKVALGTAAQGLMGSVTGTNAGVRNMFATNAQTLGILGHEAYNLDVSNPQNIPTFFSPAGGNSFKNLVTWTGPYATIAQANIIIKAADNAVGVTAAEKEATKGFAETIKALELFYVIRQTDNSGAALDALSDPTAAPPAIVSKDAVYTEILRLLDDAKTHLAAGGTSFPFSMTAGFAPFSSPSGTFLQFNRGLRGKVNVTWVSSTDAPATQTAKFTAALTDLAASFLDTTAAMSLGAYHTFSTLSGDAQNGLYDPTSRQRYADSVFATSAQLKTVGGVRDDRYTSKVDTLVPNVTRYGFVVAYKFKIYSSPTTSAVILKNEDLVLLRAEANLGLGNTSAAITDINTVRVKSGGLPPISDPYVANVALKEPAALLDELLYERRMSLMYENGDRWVDARRYGKLAAIGHERAGDIIWAYEMIPINECLPRPTPPAGCTVYPPQF